MYSKYFLKTKSHTLAFVVGAAAALAAVYITLQGITTAQAQPKAVAWVISGELKTPKGNSFYRIEDPEMKVVCYTEAHPDFSGGLSCVKK